MRQALEALHELVKKGECGQTELLTLTTTLLRHERLSWNARCHFCNGPSYPWSVPIDMWRRIEPVLGQQQACFECFAAAWQLMGYSKGEPFDILVPKEY